MEPLAQLLSLYSDIHNYSEVENLKMDRNPLDLALIRVGYKINFQNPHVVQI